MQLIKGDYLPEIRMLCFVLINNVLLNLLPGFSSCFRTIAVILVLDFFSTEVIEIRETVYSSVTADFIPGHIIR